MTCPCHVDPNVAALIYTRSGMCASCSAMTRENGVTLCKVNGYPVDFADPRGCARRKWPNDRGEVRYAGIRWVGVPMPLRWVLKVRGYIGSVYSLPGCGCVLRILNLTKRVTYRRNVQNRPEST